MNMEFTHLFLLHERKCEEDSIATLKDLLALNEELLNFYYSLYENTSSDSTEQANT